jgi:hypothetical protein
MLKDEVIVGLANEGEVASEKSVDSTLAVEAGEVSTVAKTYRQQS